MCIICVDIQKDKLTWQEARRNLGEVHTKLEKDHILEILKLIWGKEDKERKRLDDVLEELGKEAVTEYEEVIELWKTYGGS